jgi:hypothetical protein
VISGTSGEYEDMSQQVRQKTVKAVNTMPIKNIYTRRRLLSTWGGRSQ